MSHRENITRIKAVYNALEELGDDVVFVGGATVSLYADRPADEARPTDDVDVLVELIHYNGYAELEEKLRSKGFINDQESGVICRYLIDGITVDIMPTSKEILGFSNRWYDEAFGLAMQIAIDDDHTVNIFSPPYFLATKLEAYKDRGEGDGRMSSDFEDIIFVLNNRTTIWDEMKDAPVKVKQYLKDEISALLNQPYIDEWISAHLDYTEQRRVNFILQSMKEFAEAI